MKVVANNDSTYHPALKITVGKSYDVLDIDDNNFYIVDDRGVLSQYHKGFFDPLHVVESQPVQKEIDSHYEYHYTLTQDDIDNGSIKLDPYFVSAQWDIGSKDPSGVIWHIFKTCARFGLKNERSREIKAIYKSIKRLAELENVNLE